ncbi:MAG: KH domain-containing protein [Candidatus Aenigmarchaeota archaeon]|nr:KH domain-containing protein [Candidatus Aenigmarchaeota archaeon]MCX8190875.1 KH domain-containing protein [Candidatus Aenigmarchaeota archaeon]MDW8159877.1 KH domain-containing protein [Candidatus Aenigmarchaeota archaeon]
MKEYVVLSEEKAKLLKKRQDWIKKIEELSNCKVEIEDQEARVEGEDQVSVLRVKEVIKALNKGFDLKTSLYLLDENYFLDVINLKEWSEKRERRIQLKGRVIGKKGSFKKMIEEKTGTKIVIEGKTISIIGKWDGVNLARRSIEMLLEGRSHSTVQRFLERELLK